MPLTEEEKAKIIEAEKLKREEERKEAVKQSKTWLKTFFIGILIYIALTFVMSLFQ